MSGSYLMLAESAVRSTVNRRLWRGAFCIPNALPLIPFGDGARIWTPAYGCYDDRWRANIRSAFAARGYTHFEYQLSGLPYGPTEYPELAVDPVRAFRDLAELKAAGFVTVVCFADNRGPDLSYLRPVAALTQGVVDVVMGIYEVNGVFGNDTATINDVIAQGRALYPAADHYVHFTPGHGSGASDEIGWWRSMQGQLVGLLSQDDHWDDPVETGRGLESTALRLAGKIPGWDGLQFLNVAFEQCTTPVFHHWPGWDEVRQIAFAREMLTHCPSVSGFCDGGPVK